MLRAHKFNHMRWPLEYSVYKLYTDMRGMKRLMPICANRNACIHTIGKWISALAGTLGV